MAGALDDALFAGGETLASAGRRGVEARDDGVRRRRASWHFARLPGCFSVSNGGRGIARRRRARRAAHPAVDRARVVQLDVQTAGHAEGRASESSRGDRRAATRDGGRALGRRRTGRGRAGVSLVGDASPQVASDAAGTDTAGTDASRPDASRPDATGSDAVARDAGGKRAAAARGFPSGTGGAGVRAASGADAEGSPSAREPRV